MKIAHQCHKNQNFEKNGTYVKDKGVLRMPTNFLTIQPYLATGAPKKTKKAIFDNKSTSRQYARGILLFLGPDLVPDNFLCMDIEGYLRYPAKN